ncbi:flagellar biosynthetic protein FliR, partial [Pseudomonas chengduensis]|nr:flagellar biosynthetic protein FliR [Pseudomonas chengduensis]MDH1684163.1 flagellar biosynthetic protein FliR [Pseudomonas chengduensis]
MSEPVLHASQYLTSLQAYWWPFCRIVALLSMAPLFNHKAVSVRAAPLRACRNDFCREVFRAAKKKPQTARRSGISYRRLRKTRPAPRDSHRHAPFFAHIEETPDRF